jgi:hypothetical protein
MIIASVSRERRRWAVHIGESVTSRFWSSDLAIRLAKALDDAIRRHGARVELMVEGNVRASRLEAST